MARRATTFHDFVGQGRTIKRLKSLIAGSKKLGQALPSLVFKGRPGVGKTALGNALAREFGTTLDYLLACPETRPQDIGKKLVAKGHADFLFIDEGHNLSRTCQELLLPALTERKIPSPSRDRVDGNDTWISLADFTLIVATNMPSRLACALRDRLPEVVFEPFTFGELRDIAQKLGQDRGIDITGQAASRIAEGAAGSRESLAGTPRRVGQLVEELIVHLQENSSIGKDEVDWVFSTILGIDGHGLWPKHRRYLLALRAGPCSLFRLAIILGHDSKDIEEEVEPHLFTQGLIEVSAKHGRMLTAKGRQLAAELAPPQADHHEQDEDQNNTPLK